MLAPALEKSGGKPLRCPGATGLLYLAGISLERGDAVEIWDQRRRLRVCVGLGGVGYSQPSVEIAYRNR